MKSPDRNTIIFPKRLRDNEAIRKRRERAEKESNPEFTRRRREVEARREMKDLEKEYEL